MFRFAVIPPAAVAVLAALFSFVAADAFAADSSLKAGFAERDVTPEIGMEQPGGYSKVFHRKLHDPCKVRAAVFDDGNSRAALVCIDALIVPRFLVEAARKEINEKCGIDAGAVLIAASHSHSSGPVGMVMPGEYDKDAPLVRSLAYEHSSCANAEYLDLVRRRLVEAVCAADASRVAAACGAGRGFEDKVAFNRRFRMKNGLTYTHPGQLNPEIVAPAGPIDPEVGVIGAWDRDGKCIGCLVNYACHATCNPGGISANWIYYLEQTIRGAMGQQCVVVFMPGAAGDVTQVDNLNPHPNPNGEDWARLVGGRVGAEAVKTLLTMPRGLTGPVGAESTLLTIKRRRPSADRLRKAWESVRQPVDNADRTDWLFAKETVLLDAMLAREPTARVELQAVQIGPAAFISNPAELFVQLGLDIKAGSPFEFTFPVMLANGCVGYVPTEEAFGPNGGGYETRLTSYSNLDVAAGTRIVESSLEMLRGMKPGDVPELRKAPPFHGKPWSYGDVPPQID